MYQQDPQHTGRSQFAGPRQASVLRRYDTSTPDNLPPDAAIPRDDFQSSSVVGADGTKYYPRLASVDPSGDSATFLMLDGLADLDVAELRFLVVRGHEDPLRRRQGDDGLARRDRLSFLRVSLGNPACKAFLAQLRKEKS